MRLKLAGYVNKRTFSTIRHVGNKPDFVPCYITNSLERVELDITNRQKQNDDPRVTWAAFVLLDNGDWYPVDDSIKVYCK